MTIEDRLEMIEAELTAFHAMLAPLLEPQAARSWYTTEQFARAAGLSKYTVREHCRLGRLNAEKRLSGRGRYCGWSLSHQELQRYQQHGLLPRR